MRVCVHREYGFIYVGSVLLVVPGAVWRDSPGGGEGADLARPQQLGGAEPRRGGTQGQLSAGRQLHGRRFCVVAMPLIADDELPG